MDFRKHFEGKSYKELKEEVESLRLDIAVRRDALIRANCRSEALVSTLSSRAHEIATLVLKLKSKTPSVSQCEIDKDLERHATEYAIRILKAAKDRNGGE
jgi:hypothetical protein